MQLLEDDSNIMNIQTMNNITDIDMAVMGNLVDTPMHGYQLYKNITELPCVKMIWKVKIANIYAILNKFDQASYIQSLLVSNGNRPQKKQYKITDLGKKAFFEWINTPVNRSRDFRLIFQFKLFYSLKYTPSFAVQLIQNQRKMCQDWLKKSKPNGHNDQLDDDYSKYIIKFRNFQIQSYLDWLDWCEDHVLMEKK